MDNGVKNITNMLDVFKLKNELIGFIISESDIDDFEDWWDEINRQFYCEPGTLVLWDGYTFLNVDGTTWIIDGEEWESDGISGIAGWFMDLWS